MDDMTSEPILPEHAPKTRLPQDQPRYEITKLLSLGTNPNIGGRVYHAVSLGRIARDVAIKQMLRGRVFERETRILALIKHPSIPFLIEAFDDGKYSYIVMEYIRGRTLRNYREERIYRTEEALGWIIELLEVLKYLHAKGFVHRDIKEDNIKLLDEHNHWDRSRIVY